MNDLAALHGCHQDGTVDWCGCPNIDCHPPDYKKAVELLYALVNEVGAEPIEDNRARRLGAWIEARNWLESLTNFSRAAQGAAGRDV